MKRKALLLLFAASLVFAIPVHAASVSLLGFSGFDYENPDAVSVDADGSTYLSVGDGYNAVGYITSVNATLLGPWYDSVNNQYTFNMFNLIIASHNWDSVYQYLDVAMVNNGRGRYYEDPISGGSPATLGINPPNLTAPSTFTDGTLVLGGRIDGFHLYYDYPANSGGYSGSMTLDEGTYITLNYIPAAQRAGWTIGGTAGRPNSTIPAGYDNQISGECFIPATPATHTTWGAVKSLYR